MGFVLLIIAAAGPDPTPDQRYARLVGRYVVGGEPLADGSYVYRTAWTADRATKFDRPDQALEFWRLVHPLVPRRPDGHANRPWTAFTVEVRREDEPEPPLTVELI